MAQLIVRKLSDEVKEGLRRRAQRNGRSMEAEARSILSDSIQADFALASGDVVVEFDGSYDPDMVLDRFGVRLLPRDREGRAVTFEETQRLIDELV